MDTATRRDAAISVDDRPSTLRRIALVVMSILIGTVVAFVISTTIRGSLDLLDDSSVTIRDMPYGNAARPPFTEAFPQIIDARYESVAVTLADPPAEVRWLLIGEAAAIASLVLGFGALLLWLCVGALRARPFARRLSTATAVAAILTLVLGFTARWFHGASRGRVVEWLGSDSTAGADHSGSYEGFATVFDGGMEYIVLAFALLVLTIVLRIGSRMQRDVAGLV